MIRDISSIFFNGIKKTFTLKGRASKKEYIIFTIFENLALGMMIFANYIFIFAGLIDFFKTNFSSSC